MSIKKIIRCVALTMMVVYGAGVFVAHLSYSSDERTACHVAGGLKGRIWCPDSVDTAGFMHYLSKALAWPIDVAEI